MKRIAFLFVAVVTATGVIAWMAPSSLAQDNKCQVTETQTGTKESKQSIVTTIQQQSRADTATGNSFRRPTKQVNSTTYALRSATTKRSRPIAQASPSPRALSSGESLGKWFHQKRTTKHSVKRNRSFPETHPTGTCSS